MSVCYSIVIKENVKLKETLARFQQLLLSFHKNPLKKRKDFFFAQQHMDGRTLKYQLQQSENHPQSCKSHLTFTSQSKASAAMTPQVDSGGLVCFKDDI